MKTVIVALLLLVASVAQAGVLEDIIIGQPAPLEDVRVGEVGGIDFVLGLNALPDLDSPDNEFSLVAGIRINQLEIGPVMTFWPKSDENTLFGVYALRHLSYDNVVIGKPFLGFKTTVESGGMYSFIAGFDTDIEDNLSIRTCVEYRNFQDALAATHSNDNDEIIASIGPCFKF